MAKEQRIKCPVCSGNGELTAPKNNTESRKRRKTIIAKKLREEGYTIREIMALMGYKSTTSVQLLLK